MKYLQPLTLLVSAIRKEVGWSWPVDLLGCLFKTNAFNQKEYLAVDNRSCPYIIKKCIAHDFFSEAGTPELTRFFCQGDGLFFTEAFPDLEFTRGDSWENTIADGKDHCESILEGKEPMEIQCLTHTR
jgi:hypothetical protein